MFTVNSQLCHLPPAGTDIDAMEQKTEKGGAVVGRQPAFKSGLSFSEGIEVRGN
jgi:hypothetical protein